MPVTPTYPGVYVQEIPSGVRTIVGVSTSIGMFIGQVKTGLMFKPVLCLSYTDFLRNFSADTTAGQLPHYVKLFFLNGGTQCYVMRIAHNTAASSVTLRNETNTQDALVLEAKSPGLDGENTRAVVTYDTPQPEARFNIELFRWVVENGNRVRRDIESWKNLSMDPNSPAYAATFLTQNSQLVNATDPGAPTGPGFSQSGRPVQHAANDAAFQAAWNILIGPGATNPVQNHMQISVDGSLVDVNFNHPSMDVAAMPAGTVQATELPTAIKNRIEGSFTAAGIMGITVNVSFVAGPTPIAAGNVSTMLRIASGGTGDVYIQPANQGDMAVPLMLGTEQGGVEVSVHAVRRPAPSGISFQAFDPAAIDAFGALRQDAITSIALEAFQIPPAPGFTTRNVPLNLVSTNAADNMFVDALAGSPTGNNNGLREKLSRIAAAINAEAAANPRFPWTAVVSGTRLTIQAGGATEDNFRSSVFATAPSNLAAHFTNNVKYYTLGVGGLNVGLQVAGTKGSDGTAPAALDYDAAYRIIDSEVDLFNLMALPPNEGSAITVQSLYGAASTFCEQRRAFLLLNPPESWRTVQDVINATTGVNALRVGLAKQYSALFFPRITIDDGGKKLNIGPAGALAGLFARIDGTRGVWKAPAGTEADLRGVLGLEYKLSDGENGVTNPHAVNTLRVFPNGIVNWGARTNDGDDNFASEYKYIPIRRLALYIEESLYRGLKWVVFEPNDEPLWAQIRLNVGAFMHNLFRQGAFQGQTARDAYFVKCDKETTTQNDRNLGIVNIMVGFAPLKPAEFVILYLQQMAGQIQV